MESQRCRDERALFRTQPVEFQAGMMTFALLDFDHEQVPRDKLGAAHLMSEVSRALKGMGHLDMSDAQVQAMVTRGVINEIEEAKRRQQNY